MTRVALVLLVAAAACQGDDARIGSATAVKLAVVQRAGNPVGTRYSAQIIPATEVKLAFKVEGYVESIAKVNAIGGPRWIQEGDVVHEGMQLAALRTTEFKQRITEARAARAQAGAGAHQARLDFGRSQTLLDHNAVAGADLDSARTQLNSASAAYSGAEARYEAAKTALADSVIYAPLDGIVMKRSLQVGELVAPGTLAFSVADVSSVKAAFGVPDTMLSRIQLGALEMVTTEAYPGEKFEGTITLIAPSADPNSRVFEVDVTISNSDGRLKTGTVASLALATSQDPATMNAPLVPISAVVRSPLHGDRFAVFVVEQAGARWIARAREVELDDYLGRAVPVKKGLREGDRIVIQGAKLISDGEEVEVIQ
jgi:RND family efflux transporter MFP subunit